MTKCSLVNISLGALQCTCAPLALSQEKKRSVKLSLVTSAKYALRRQKTTLYELETLLETCSLESHLDFLIAMGGVYVRTRRITR